MKLWKIEEKGYKIRTIKAVVIAEHQSDALVLIFGSGPLNNEYDVREVDLTKEAVLLRVDEQVLFDDGYYRAQEDAEQERVNG